MGLPRGRTYGGSDPYSSSKGCSELITAAYRNSFFNPAKYNLHKVGLASARAGNVIGGGDWAKDRLIPDILAQLKWPKCKYSQPKCYSPLAVCFRALRGYLSLAEKLYTKGSTLQKLNFGPSEEDAKSVLWVVKNLLINGALVRSGNTMKPRTLEAHYLNWIAPNQKYFELEPNGPL